MYIVVSKSQPRGEPLCLVAFRRVTYGFDDRVNSGKFQADTTERVEFPIFFEVPPEPVADNAFYVVELFRRINEEQPGEWQGSRPPCHDEEVELPGLLSAIREWKPDTPGQYPNYGIVPVFVIARKSGYEYKRPMLVFDERAKYFALRASEFVYYPGEHEQLRLLGYNATGCSASERYPQPCDEGEIFNGGG